MIPRTYNLARIMLYHPPVTDVFLATLSALVSVAGLGSIVALTLSYRSMRRQ